MALSHDYSGKSTLRPRAPFRGQGLKRQWGRPVKRLVDVCVALMALLITSPLFVVCGFLIRRDGGPAFFMQHRVGRHGNLFPCFKFRTMVVDAQARLDDLLANDRDAAAEWAACQKLRRDPRVTRVGRFLRTTSLDELPQLINVLRGEMSIVGPRPVIESELERYGAHTDTYLSVRPGITGLWQVSGRNNMTYDERVRLDVDYVRRQSLWLDFIILLCTVREVLWTRSGY